MPSFGDFNGFPYEFGDDPSSEESIFMMLRRAGGDGFAADDTLDVSTLDGLWFAAQAAGLAAVESVEEAAHWQGFPSTATDEIEGYEKVLGVVPPIGASLEERRAVVVDLWTERILADFPSLIGEIGEVTDQAQVIEPAHFAAGTTMAGKVYEAMGSPGLFHAGRTCSNYPNFSDDHVVTVRLVGGGPVLPEGLVGRWKAAIEDELDRRLPAWNDFRVVTDIGFVLDSSLLDVTGFGA